MDGRRTNEDIASGRVTLVVFLPDALESRLVGSTERWIRDRTSCVPIARHGFQFTEAALDRFYPGLAARIPEDWELLSSVFSAGQSLATLWLGDSAVERIPKVKGETHPARCSGSTLRGRFWCDNAVANLVHASDDCKEVVRELEVLRSLVPDLFHGWLATRELAPFSDPGTPAPRHSGILTLCSLVATLLIDQGASFPQLELPENGDARKTMRAAESWLKQSPTGDGTPLTHALRCYLAGTAEPAELLAVLRAAVHVGRWEELMLRCGLSSRRAWLETR